MKRHFRYAVADWCHRFFGAQIGTAGLCGLATALDVDLDLVNFDQWDAVKASGVGLSCVLPDMGTTGKGKDKKPLPPFVPGFNDPKHAKRVYDAIDLALDRAAEAGIKFILVFTGMDTGDPRILQFDRIVDGFTKARGTAKESLIQKAERLGITFVVEMLNTVGDEATWRGHPGYLGNDTRELFEKVVRPIDSPYFKLAFDVYHVSMMSEDVLALIGELHEFIGYVHVAGVMWAGAEEHHPKNRGELSLPGQLVDYATVCATLAEYLPEKTYVLFEYMPTINIPADIQHDLQQAIALCESKIVAA